MVACGRVNDLVGKEPTQCVEMVVTNLGDEGVDHLRPLSEKIVVQGIQVLVVLKSHQYVNNALDIVRSAKATLVSLTPHKGSLEDLFMRQVEERHQQVESLQ
jgi:ABC-2 type transport system ATP-binding protein